MADASKQFTFNMAPGQFNVDNNAFPLALGPSRVERITVSFPPGCANSVNCQIRVGGSPVFPSIAGTFFHFDGKDYVVPVTTPHYNGDWSIAIANAGLLPHEIQVNVEYTYLSENTLTSEMLPASL